MKIEIDNISTTDGKYELWAKGSQNHFTNDLINITLDNGNKYVFSLTSFIFYIAHRSYGTGKTKQGKMI